MDGCSYGLRSKDAEKTANGNPALLVEDNSTNGTNCTQESESMCGNTFPAVVCAHDAVCSYGSGAMSADNSKTKNIGKNQKIPAPGGNLLNPELHPTITQPEKTGTMPDKKSGPDASGTIPLSGVPGSREFLKVDPALSGRL